MGISFTFKSLVNLCASMSSIFKIMEHFGRSCVKFTSVVLILLDECNDGDNNSYWPECAKHANSIFGRHNDCPDFVSSGIVPNLSEPTNERFVRFSSIFDEYLIDLVGFKLQHEINMKNKRWNKIRRLNFSEVINFLLHSSVYKNQWEKKHKQEKHIGLHGLL